MVKDWAFGLWFGVGIGCHTVDIILDEKTFIVKDFLFLCFRLNILIEKRNE